MDAPSVELEPAADLVNLAFDLAVEDEPDEQVLNLLGRHVKLLRPSKVSI